MNTETLFSSAKSGGTDVWATPEDLFDTLDAHFHFTLDASATGANALHRRFYGPGSPIAQDALQVSWGTITDPDVVWLNPPYSLNKEFLRHANQEAMFNGALVVCLVPARTDVRWFHEIVWKGAAQIIFLKGRLKFGGAKDSAPFPSMLVIFDGRNQDFPRGYPEVGAWDWRADAFGYDRIFR